MVIIAHALILWHSLADPILPHAPREERMRPEKHLLPPLAIFFVVMGASPKGWATPTLADVIGGVIAFVLALGNRALSLTMLVAMFIAMIEASAMLPLIVTAAFFLNFIMGHPGVPRSREPR